MSIFEQACRIVEHECEQPLRPYATYHHGQKKDESLRSLLISVDHLDWTEKQVIWLLDLRALLPEGTTVYMGYVYPHQENGNYIKELVVAEVETPWDPLRLARTQATETEWLQTEQLIYQLQMLTDGLEVELLEASTDLVVMYFGTLPRDQSSFIRKLGKICPDLSTREMLKELRQTQLLTLWWD